MNELSTTSFNTTAQEALESDFSHNEEGWDIVLGNPPFIGEKGNREIFQKVKNSELRECYQGKMDYFYFFFHRCFYDLLKTNGILSFITTNYFPTAQGGRKLREELKQNANIKTFINFNEHKVFKSATGQHNAISILSKAPQEEAQIYHFKASNLVKNLKDTLKDLNLIAHFKSDSLYESEESYMRLSPKNDIMESVFIKLKTDSKALGEICAINQGIVSGADKVTQKHLETYHWQDIGLKKGNGIYVVSEAEARAKNLEKAYLKPCFKNSDIQKYTTKLKSSQYFLYLTGKESQDSIPHILEHLSNFKANLEERREVHKGSRLWWSLWRSRKQEIFETAKIVAPQRSKTNTFGYNEVSWYASADVYFITSVDSEFSLKYILALLNSKLYYFWLYHKGKRKGENLELYQTPLSEIPIKPIAPKDQEPFIALVDEILALNSCHHKGFIPKNLTNTQSQDSKNKDSFSLSQKEKGFIPSPLPLAPKRIKPPLFLFGNQGESLAISASSSKSVEALLPPLIRFSAPRSGRDIESLQSRIDSLVYALYDLTQEEIAIIENANKTHKSTGGVR
ncbi:hypothetical protein LS68_008990 [Helicobacter sp. MIT 05-5293]|uniref:Eco57I restriction-modification methylase domain-containing protein n=1 Tax=Helicobacter sp. MIT 05-5293 TaxID=1548149 RepID=UPI0010FE04F0|nr:TaqI-like C-terminal specificity domain-containing protein [Helicobacter sp. MIT 05-5293]TLD79964.1 hypothetical protein LS68_008990 [Helicobacter sp. MIT 05-5293]